MTKILFVCQNSITENQSLQEFRALQVPVEIGLNLRPISATDLHSKSKEAGKHPWGLPALITAEQDRAGLSMAAHEMRRSS